MELFHQKSCASKGWIFSACFDHYFTFLLNQQELLILPFQHIKIFIFQLRSSPVGEMPAPYAILECVEKSMNCKGDEGYLFESTVSD